MGEARRIAVGPAGAPPWLEDAVRAGGGEVVELHEASALLWAAPDDPEGLRLVLAEHGGHLEWIQLPWAGVERYADVLDHGRRWTSGKGVYAAPVAELALALALAGLRGLDRYARSGSWRERGTIGVNLGGAKVTILGGGGITEALLRLLAPFDARITVVRQRPEPVGGAWRTVGPAGCDAALAGADVVILALALTPGTRGLMDARRLALLSPTTCLVNVARGGHVVTDALVDALARGAIGAAGLDVTDPEPLPDGHPLWALPNCIITPHVGNTPAMARPLLAERVRANVARWIAGQPLIGPVDVGLGY